MISLYDMLASFFFVCSVIAIRVTSCLARSWRFAVFCSRTLSILESEADFEIGAAGGGSWLCLCCFLDLLHGGFDFVHLRCNSVEACDGFCAEYVLSILISSIASCMSLRTSVLTLTATGVLMFWLLSFTRIAEHANCFAEGRKVVPAAILIILAVRRPSSGFL